MFQYWSVYLLIINTEDDHFQNDMWAGGISPANYITLVP